MNMQKELDDLQKKLQGYFNVGQVQIQKGPTYFKVIYSVRIENSMHHCIINFSYDDLHHTHYIIKMLMNEVEKGFFKVIFK